MKIIKFRFVDKHPIIATFDLLLPSGLIIRKFRLMRGAQGIFISFPSEKYIDKDGSARYSAFIAFDDNTKREYFNSQAMTAVKTYIHDNPHEVSGKNIFEPPKNLEGDAEF